MLLFKKFDPSLFLFVAALTTACHTTEIRAQNEVDDLGDVESKSDLVSFLEEGKLNLNARFRYEYADIDGFDESNAFTLRTRLGYTTKRFEGFQAMIEFEDMRSADEDQYNAAGLNGQPGRSVIADPVDTELNQLWVDYDFRSLDGDLPITARLGRQRMIFDDARFIGNVGWRQLEQTMDAVKLTATPIEGFQTTYAYIDEVNRIFGPDSGRDFNSDSHLVNVSYAGLEIGKIVGFAYLLDLGASGASVSSQTYGLRLDGNTDLNDELAIGYIGSVAFQSDYSENATNYDALYFLLESKLKFKQANSFFGGGVEVLGSDDGVIAFSTPLATGHKFNGFADSFLATPAQGLRDYYLMAGFDVPDHELSFAAYYHYFTGDDTAVELGTEIDLVMSKKLHDNVKLVMKYAYYDGDAGRADIHRFWLQIDLSY